ncbi:MAG: hypothetical protein ABWZ77_02235 [Naasia sp.]
MSDPIDPRPSPDDRRTSEAQAGPTADVFGASAAGAGTPAMQQPAASGGPTEREERATVRIRRSPKLSGFALAGVMVGVVVALVLTFAFPADQEFSPSQVFGFLLLFSAVVFGALGVVVALVFENISRRRAREIQADRRITNDPDGDD